MPSSSMPKMARPGANETELLNYPAVQPAGLAAGAADSSAEVRHEPAFELMWTNLQPRGTHLKYTDDDLRTRIQAAEKQAREQGARDAETRLRAEYGADLAIERQVIAQALESFERERATYFERVEAEVVQLGLAIARKILHREAQIDPLFLTGMVRVAIEKVAAESSVKVRVPENEVVKWRQILAALKGLRTQLELVGDPTLSSGCCIMQTEVGSTDISLDSQFQEIERGLLDLLALRPAS